MTDDDEGNAHTDGVFRLNFTNITKETESFKYYGNSYQFASLSSNGYITFGGNDTSSVGTFQNVFESGLPRISAFFTPMIPVGICCALVSSENTHELTHTRAHMLTYSYRRTQ